MVQDRLVTHLRAVATEDPATCPTAVVIRTLEERLDVIIAVASALNRCSVRVDDSFGSIVLVELEGWSDIVQHTVVDNNFDAHVAFNLNFCDRGVVVKIRTTACVFADLAVQVSCADPTDFR